MSSRRYPQGYNTDRNNCFRQAQRPFAQGDYMEALRLFTDSIAQDPLNDAAYCSRSTAFAEILDWISSREDSKRALQLNRLSARARVNHARACYMIGDLQSALMSVSDGMASFPGSKALQTLSRLILFKLGAWDDHTLYGDELDSADLFMDDDLAIADECGPRLGNPYVRSPTVATFPVAISPSPPPLPTDFA